MLPKSQQNVEDCIVQILHLLVMKTGFLYVLECRTLVDDADMTINVTKFTLLCKVKDNIL